MERPNAPLFYPPSVAAYADDEELAQIIDSNNRHQDASAAHMLAGVANHHRDDWQDPKFATFARRVMRLVASHLEDRSRG